MELNIMKKYNNLIICNLIIILTHILLTYTIIYLRPNNFFSPYMIYFAFFKIKGEVILGSPFILFIFYIFKIIKINKIIIFFNFIILYITCYIILLSMAGN